MYHVLFFLFLFFSSILFYNLLSRPLYHDPLVISNIGFFAKNSTCDYSYGKWIWDEKYVVDQYNENCPFLDPGFRCRKSGRRDMDYRKWRWQPQHCHLPRVPFLVVVDRPPANASKEVRGVIRLDKLHWYFTKWVNADVIIFNAGHWWNEDKTINMYESQVL
ncbi:hypothetical protein EJD97_012305 [Solanum chilense]|uniref:Trichome birefringence-like N-terminal domain-containing protein n=1 Tax=Solanum chilense TaxID=4083 RepID=A0A6N2BIY8_SOLCI|nr:hypothetical protein EJD97_012305 [Solanum chilense]